MKDKNTKNNFVHMSHWFKKKIKVLDHGFVEYVTHMGDDLTVVNAARVSFNKESEWSESNVKIENGQKTFKVDLSMRDKKLIDYLAKHNHWTPFAHPQITFRVKAPIFIRTQLFKHKVGIVENEVSRRYVTMDPEFYTPYWRTAPTNGAKQGSSDFICDGEELKSIRENGDLTPKDNSCIELDRNYKEFVSKAKELYYELLEKGIAPEQARGVLPQSTYTEWWWTGSLSAFARVCKLRAESHAQWEVQQYASGFSEIMKRLYPYCWEKLC